MKGPVGVVQNRIGIPGIPKESDYWELFQLSLNAWLRILGISPDRENLKSFIKCAALCEPRGKGRENLGMGGIGFLLAAFVSSKLRLALLDEFDGFFSAYVFYVEPEHGNMSETFGNLGIGVYSGCVLFA